MQYEFISGDEFLAALNSENILKDSFVDLGCLRFKDPNVVKAVEAALLSGKCPQGLQINLNDNNIGAAGAKDIAMALQSGNCPQGLLINLSWNPICDAGAKYIAAALQSGECPQGLQINLRISKIGDEGAKDIAMALQSGKCPSGLQIHLGDNRIRAASAKDIAMALQSGNCPQGLQINLEGNNIGNEGAIAIAEALQSGKCPQRLQIHLGGNNIGTEGAIAIAEALQSGKCPQGLQIHFGDNNIGNEVAIAFAEALQSVKPLPGLQIHFGDNNIDNEYAIALAEALQSVKPLPGLQIGPESNNISAQGFQALANAILSGKCPQGLRLEGVEGMDLVEKLAAVLPPPPEKDERIISDENEWPNRFNTIRDVFCVKPEIILENTILTKRMLEAFSDYTRGLQSAISEKMSKTDYRDSYYPVFLEVANVILAMAEVSQSASDTQKELVSNLLLTLAETVVPQFTQERLSDLYFWTHAQRLVLMEKALSLYSTPSTGLARYWQDYCDKINDVKKEDRKFDLDGDVEKIKAAPENTSAVNYFNQVESKGFTTQPGVVVLPKAQTDFFAVPERAQEPSFEVPLGNNNNLRL